MSKEGKMNKEHTEKVNEAEVNEKVADNTTETATEEPKELSFEDKYNEVNDKYLRLYSDFENFRKRNAKERVDLINNAGSDIIRDLLAVLDDCDRAIQNNEKSEDINAVKEGFNLIHHKLKHILTQKGLKDMESIGTAFDTDLHEAVTNIPAPSDDMKGKVVDVAEKGYYLNDKVLRFAKVIVGQ